jgi:hypothetical protein
LILTKVKGNDVNYVTATCLLACLGIGLPCQASSNDKGRAADAAAPHVKSKLALPRPAGNAAIDVTLNRFAKANKDNPAALAAIQSATPGIKAHPEKYMGADGQINQAAIARLLTQKMGGAASIAVPGPASAADDDGKR